MCKLESKRTILGDLGYAVFFGAVIAGIFRREIHSLISYLSVVAIGLIPWALYWALVGRKPAAWIENDDLFVKTWPFSIARIPRSEVEELWYESGIERKTYTNKHAKIDRLIVRMKGFEDWQIPIVDKIDHLPEKRLLKFIDTNFHKVSLKTES